MERIHGLREKIGRLLETIDTTLSNPPPPPLWPEWIRRFIACLAQLDSIQKDLIQGVCMKQVVPGELTEGKLRSMPNAVDVIPNVLLRSKLAPEVEKGRLGSCDGEVIGSGVVITRKLMAQMLRDASDSGSGKHQTTQITAKTTDHDHIIQAVKAIYTL